MKPRRKSVAAPEAVYIGEVEVDNFGAYVRAKVDFDTPGLTVIEGKNGEGKSTLLEAPVWALTGKLLRDGVAPDEVIHLDPDGKPVKAGCMVRVTLRGSINAVIRRSVKHHEHGTGVQFIVDGVDQTAGTNTETTSRIATVLGADAETLMQTVAFCARAGVRSFFTAPDAERKRIFSTLLGLDRFVRAQKLAATAHTEAQMSQASLMTAQMNEGLRLNELRSARERAATATGIDVAATKKALREAETRRYELADRVRRAETRRSECIAADQERRAENNAARGEWKRLIEVEDAKIQQAISRRAQAEEKCDQATKTFKRMRSLADAKKCSQCDRPVSAAEVRQWISDAETLAIAFAEEHEKAIEALQDRRARRDAVKEPAQFEPDPRIEELGKKLADRRDAHAKSESEIATLRTQLQAASAVREQAATFGETIKKVERKIEKIDAELLEVQGQLVLTSFWSTGFGARGVQSYLVESELPAINHDAQIYAVKLIGEGVTVRFDATKKLKSSDALREQMSSHIKLPGAAQSYATASRSQRHRLDIAVLLALRNMIARRAGIKWRQLFADEMFDGLDSAGVEKVQELLEDLSREAPVMLATHDSRLQGIGNRRLVVTHANGVATVEER